MQTLIDERDVVVDHGKGIESVVQEIRDAMQGPPSLNVTFDPVSEQGSFAIRSQVLGKGGRLSCPCYPGIRPEIPAYQ